MLRNRISEIESLKELESLTLSRHIGYASDRSFGLSMVNYIAKNCRYLDVKHRNEIIKKGVSSGVAVLPKLISSYIIYYKAIKLYLHKERIP